MSNNTLNQNEKELLQSAKIGDLYGLVRFMNAMDDKARNQVSGAVYDLVMLKIVAAGWIQPDQSASAFHVFIHHFSDKVSDGALQRAQSAYKMFDNRLGLYLLDSLGNHKNNSQAPVQNESMFTFTSAQNHLHLALVK